MNTVNEVVTLVKKHSPHNITIVLSRDSIIDYSIDIKLDDNRRRITINYEYGIEDKNKLFEKADTLYNKLRMEFDKSFIKYVLDFQLV